MFGIHNLASDESESGDDSDDEEKDDEEEEESSTSLESESTSSSEDEVEFEEDDDKIGCETPVIVGRLYSRCRIDSKEFIRCGMLGKPSLILDIDVCHRSWIKSFHGSCSNNKEQRWPDNTLDFTSHAF
jgi:hypothetical protein